MVVELWSVRQPYAAPDQNIKEHHGPLSKSTALHPRCPYAAQQRAMPEPELVLTDIQETELALRCKECGYIRKGLGDWPSSARDILNCLRDIDQAVERLYFFGRRIDGFAGPVRHVAAPKRCPRCGAHDWQPDVPRRQ